MRTTLELDDDLVNEAKRLAREQGVSLGQVVSDLVRRALPASPHPKFRNGVEVFESRPASPGVDLELVNRLREEE